MIAAPQLAPERGSLFLPPCRCCIRFKGSTAPLSQVFSLKSNFRLPNENKNESKKPLFLLQKNASWLLMTSALQKLSNKKILTLIIKTNFNYIWGGRVKPQDFISISGRDAAPRVLIRKLRFRVGTLRARSTVILRSMVRDCKTGK